MGSAQIGWAAAKFTMMQGQNMMNHILLDSGSTTSLFCNTKYCKHIRNAKHLM